MELYRMLIRPQISHPDQYYKPVCRDLEQGGKWYAEEEKEAIKEKYKHLENTFEKVVFDVKYEPVPAIPVEWLKAQIRPYTGDVSDIGKSATNGTIKGIIRKWQKEQEEHDT